MDLTRAVRLIAIKSVLKPDRASALRKICAWYGETFSITPIEAEKLPVRHILLHYFEAMYRRMDFEQLEDEIRLLLKSEEDLEAEADAARQAEIEADEFAAFVAKQAAAEEAARNPIHANLADARAMATRLAAIPTPQPQRPEPEDLDYDQLTGPGPPKPKKIIKMKIDEVPDRLPDESFEITFDDPILDKEED